MFDHHQILSSSITSPSKYNPCNPEFLRKYCEIFLTGKYVLSIDAGVGTVGPPSMTKNHSALQVKIADMCDLTFDSMPSIFILYYFPPPKKTPKKKQNRQLQTQNGNSRKGVRGAVLQLAAVAVAVAAVVQQFLLKRFGRSVWM